MRVPLVKFGIVKMTVLNEFIGTDFLQISSQMLPRALEPWNLEKFLYYFWFSSELTAFLRLTQ